MIVPTLTEVLIVLIGFGVVGAYLAVVHHFIKRSEENGAAGKTGAYAR